MGKQNEEQVHNFSPFVVSTALTKIIFTPWAGEDRSPKDHFIVGEGDQNLEGSEHDWEALPHRPVQISSSASCKKIIVNLSLAKHSFQHYWLQH